MKLKKLFFALFPCLFISFISYGQGNEPYRVSDVTYLNNTRNTFRPLPDSIRIEFPDQHGLVVMMTKDISKKMFLIERIPGNLSSWLTSIGSAVPDSSVPFHIKIKVKKTGDYEMTLKESPPKITTIIAKNNTVTQLLPPGWEIVAESPEDKVCIYAQTFRELQEIAKQNFQLAAEKITNEIRIHPMYRKSLLSRMIYKNDQVNYSDMVHRNVGDFLNLGGSGGFGFLNGHFFPELNIDINLTRGNRLNVSSDKVALIYNNQFFSSRGADGRYRSDVNSFLSLAWSKNVLAGKGKHAWAGVGAGLLIHREGDYYKGNTMKVFILTSTGRFTLSPELYWTNGYKNFYSGFKISYGF